MSQTKKSIIFSALTLVLCIAMFLGTTYAWFSDSITSGKNKITAGHLDIEMYWTDDYEKAEAGTGEWYNVEDPAHEKVFDYDNWEPGYTQLRYLKIKNGGNLAFKYKLGIGAAGAIGKLAEVIDVYYIPDVNANIDTRAKLFNVDEENARPTVGTLKYILENQNNGAVNPEGKLLPANASSVPDDCAKGEVVVALAFKMQEEAGNEYQNESIGEGFYITAAATQLEYEEDTFDNTYDEDLAFPALNLPKNVSSKVELDEDNKVKADTELENGTSISATVPAGVEMEAGTKELVMTVKEVRKFVGNIDADDNIISKTLDVHVEGVASGNTTPILVKIKNVLPSDMNRSAVVLYHTENGEKVKMHSTESLDAVTVHNDYYFDTDGNLTMALAHFSEILLKVDASNLWGGGTKIDWYDASKTEFAISTAEQLAGLAELVNDGKDFSGKTVVLDKSIVLNNWESGEKFYTPEELHNDNSPVYYDFRSDPHPEGKPYYFIPIGTDENPFKGTFDGNGHFISGLYRIHYGENDGYDNANIGIFGCVDGATIKNLTVKDGFVESFGGLVGVVAATAKGDNTFDNIKIRNNYILTYNEYLGGVVGYYGEGTGTFKDISVDNTNNFGALWGTYDLPCGGIIGGVGSSTNIKLTDCNIFPSMDLYNDCCANYQWFNYRYSGMLVGYLPGSDIESFADVHITCENVSVYYGPWTSEYYCELRSLGKGSYNGETEWKYTKIDRNDGAAGKCGHEHANNNAQTTTWRGVEYGPNEAHEDHICVNIAFHQLFGGGQGVKGVEAHNGVKTVEKGSISVKFPNTDKYLYRVGNMNTVALGSLFEKAQNTPNNIDPNAIDIEAEQIAGVTSVEYVKNSDWTKSTLKFSGTGVTKLVLRYADAEPVELNLEVVEAMNATTLTNAEKYDVVLLSDVGLGNGNRFMVSNGHTLFGNGFKISTSFAGYGLKGRMADAFVELTDGNLVDTQVISAIYPRGYLYNTSTSFGEALEDANNLNTSIVEGKNYYFYQYNAVKISGRCSISGCYIEGARNNIYVTDGTDGSVISNTTLAYGALANMYVGASSGTLKLRDITTIQDVKKTNLPDSELNKDDNHKNDGEKTVFGMGILVGNDETPSYPTLKFEGHFTQHNWIKKDTKVSSSITNMLINSVFNGNNEYIHNIGDEYYANIGVVYMSSNTVNINTDSFTDKANYKLGNVSMSGVGTGQTYSFIGSADSVEIPEYTFTSGDEARIGNTILICKNTNYTAIDAYDTESKALIPTISVDLEAGQSAYFAVNDIMASRSGLFYTPASFKVDGTTVSSDYVIEASSSKQTVIECSGTTDGYYDASGKFVNDEQSYTLLFKFNVVSKNIDPPKFVNTDNYSKNTHWVSGWTIATTPIENIDLTYFSQSRGCYVTVPLSVFTPSANGKSSNGETTWTGTYDGCTLILSAPADIKTGYKGAFYTSNGTMYYTLSNKAGYSNTTAGSTRQATVSITVTDANSKSATFSKVLVATYNDSATKLSDSWATITGGSTTKYIVRLDAAGGSVSPTASSALASGSSFALPTPTREGFGFDGWFDQPTDGTLIGMGNATYKTTKANVVLYAHWHSLSPRALAFNANGGSCDTTSVTCIGGTVQTLPEVTRDGYWCTGWWTAASGGTNVGKPGGSYKHPETDGVTYYAQWSPVYTVTYNADGGSVTPASAKYEGTALTLPTPTTTDTNKAFVGWYSGDKEITSPYTPTANVTLSAKWNTKVTVSYDTDGGSTAPASQTIGQGASITLATAPTKTGYTFNGWSDGSNTYNAGDSYTANASVTLTARWMVNSYNIKATSLSNASFTVKYNGKTETISNTSTTISVPYGTSVTITVNYSQSDSQSCTIKSGNTTYGSGTAFSMPAADIELTATSSKPSCILPGTLITMADGTQKPVEEIDAGDMLLTWDLTAGTYGAKPVVFNDYEEAAECDVIYVTFSDGTEIGVISEHGFFDKDLGKYVYLDENAAQYLGHAFIKEDGSTVTLTDVEIRHEYTKCYSPTTFGDLCYYTNGMLSMPGGISGLFNIFDVDSDTMRYDEAKMQADIETYGLLDMDAFGGMITEDMFNAFNGKYLGIAVGKGNLTWEYIAYLAERYAPLCGGEDHDPLKPAVADDLLDFTLFEDLKEYYTEVVTGLKDTVRSFLTNFPFILQN